MAYTRWAVAIVPVVQVSSLLVFVYVHLTLYQPRMATVVVSHRHIYMDVLILGVILQYMVSPSYDR